MHVVPVLASVHHKYYVVVSYVAVNLHVAEHTRLIAIIYIRLRRMASGTGPTRVPTCESGQIGVTQPDPI